MPRIQCLFNLIQETTAFNIQVPVSNEFYQFSKLSNKNLVEIVFPTASEPFFKLNIIIQTVY